MIHFVGAGPGAPDLITVRGQRLLQEADQVIYAGSLVNPELLKLTKEGCRIYNSAVMTLEEVLFQMQEGEEKGWMTVRPVSYTHLDQDGIDSADKDAGVREPVGNRFIVSAGMLHAGFGFAVKAFDLLNKSADSGLGVWDIAGLHKNYIAGPADGDSAFAFRNIDTNSVHDKNSFEMN